VRAKTISFCAEQDCNYSIRLSLHLKSLVANAAIRQYFNDCTKTFRDCNIDDAYINLAIPFNISLYGVVTDNPAVQSNGVSVRLSKFSD
jgi:hypothetical protein